MRSALDGEIFGHHRDKPPVDLAESADHAIGRGHLIGMLRGLRDMGAKLAVLLKSSRIEQPIDPVSHRPLALRDLALDALLAAHFQRAPAPFVELR